MAPFIGITRAVQEFVEDLVNLPVDKPIDSAVENAAIAEHELRLLFRAGHRVEDQFLGLVNVFSMNPSARRTRARDVSQSSKVTDHYLFPLSTSLRRRSLTPSTVFNLEAFQKQWDIFTHGTLSKMRTQDWENVVVAGGSVLACLLPPQANSTERRINEQFQSPTWASSAIDLFLWGLSPKQAEAKMVDIYHAICRAVPLWKVICIRRAGAVSIHTTYPFRPVQIILRLFQSPAEILAEFDVDPGCLVYNGKEVWANPRAVAALVRQASTVDMSMRSPSYETRLAKYADRGFEIYVPSLKREQVDAALYDRDRREFPNGLARLLVLEAAYAQPSLYTHLGYSKAVDFTLAGSIDDEELRWAHIPYGLSWDAERVKDLITRHNTAVNSRCDPLDQRQTVHRHMFFTGSMRRCLSPACVMCDPVADGMEHEDQNPEEAGIYIKGHIGFVAANPGRQSMVGAFPAVAVADWEREAYINSEESQEGQMQIAEIVDSDSDSDSDTSDSEYRDAESGLFA